MLHTIHDNHLFDYEAECPYCDTLFELQDVGKFGWIEGYCDECRYGVGQFMGGDHIVVNDPEGGVV